MKRSTTTLGFTLLLLALPALAQESKPPRRALESADERAEPTPHELLAAAMLRHRQRTDMVVAAKIEQKQPQEEPKAGGGNAPIVQVVIQGPGMNGREPYEGRVEAWRDTDGTTVLVSERELPGFGLYLTPERTIRRTTTDGTAPGTDQLRAEMLSFLETDRFCKEVLAAELKHRVDAATGEHVWFGPIAREIVRPVRPTGGDPRFQAVMQGVRPRVLRANVELRISKEGALRSAQVTLVRNDPAREMMRGGGFNGIIVRNGKIQRQPEQPQDDDEKHDIEGVSTIYSLDFSKKEPSERAKAFKREIARALRE